MAIAPKSLIFMRRYEVTDFHWGFLAIFYNMEASTKRTHGHSTQVINIHEKIWGHRFPLGFSSTSSRSNTLNLRTHGHSTQVITNIHEKIWGHGFPLAFLATSSTERAEYTELRASTKTRKVSCIPRSRSITVIIFRNYFWGDISVTGIENEIFGPISPLMFIMELNNATVHLKTCSCSSGLSS